MNESNEVQVVKFVNGVRIGTEDVTAIFLKNIESGQFKVDVDYELRLVFVECSKTQMTTVIPIEGIAYIQHVPKPK